MRAADVAEPPRASLPPAAVAALIGAVALAGVVGLRLLPYLRGELPLVFLTELTLPRLLGAALGGAGLAVCGAVLQGLTRNPMASPAVLGITAGAHLALVLAVMLAGGWVPAVVASFIGAVFAMALTWTLAGRDGREGAALALAGVAVNLCLSALAAALTLLNEQQMAGAFLWSAGAPVQAGWDPLVDLAPWLVAGTLLALPLAPGLDLLALGRTFARGIGLAPRRVAIGAFLAAGLTAGAAVALMGPVAFVGLVAPNGLRRCGFRRHAVLLPLAALWGAVLLAAADGVAVAASGLGREVPVGVVTALMGAPVFLWLVAYTRPAGSAVDFGGSGRRGRHVVVATAVALAVVAGASLAVGGTGVSVTGVWAALTGDGGSAARIVWELRLPRLLVALGAGALLALAGQLLQAALRNPLAGPETLGVTQAAALSALAALMAGAVPGGVVMQVAAVVGGMGALAVVAGVARRSGLAPVSLVLGGIALAALCASASALAVLVAELQAARALVWLTGSVYARGWQGVAALMPLGLAVAIAAWVAAPRLELLGLGDAKARSLGAPPAATRLLAGALAAVATAAAVSVAGSITFVGLLGPHMARLLYGGGFRCRMPLVVACGGGVTALADLLGRTLIAPEQLPAGVMTALVGAPYFLWLLRRART